MRAVLLISLAILLQFATQLRAAEPAPIQDQPLEISSGRLEADESARRVTFLDKVVARQGDVVIYAESLSIYYADEKREITRIVAEKDVRIVQGSRVVTGERAEYEHRTGIIELTGHPKVHQGKDAVSGDKITVYLNEEKSVISGAGGSRVNALFHPSEEKP